MRGTNEVNIETFVISGLYDEKRSQAALNLPD
jgi:hypothetical protein